MLTSRRYSRDICRLFSKQSGDGGAIFSPMTSHVRCILISTHNLFIRVSIWELIVRIRSKVSGILAVIMVFMSGSIVADEASGRDAELMTALRIIAARDGGWSRNDWQEFAYTAAKYGLMITAVAGMGATAYYFRDPIGFAQKRIGLSTDALKSAGKFLAAHGGKVALGVAAPIVINNVVNRLAAMNNISEAERLRNASTPDARVYRSHLKKFFRLSLSEQFLIARQDPILTDDLIRLARWIEADHSRVAHSR